MFAKFNVINSSERFCNCALIGEVILLIKLSVLIIAALYVCLKLVKVSCAQMYYYLKGLTFTNNIY